MDVHREEGSFRDSSGYVVYLDQKIYRLIYSSYKAQYDELVSSGLYSSLAEKGLLIPHLDITDFAGTVPSSLHGNGELYKVIAPEQIPFISYPYEWSPLQLKKAALLTLDIQLEALSKGFILKDASAYNVQFRGHAPVFIDTLSFEKYEEGSPWQGYKQFCQQFLAPLLLSAYGHPELCALQQLHLDGIPLKLVSRILPFRSRFSAFIAIHIHYHAKLENNFSGAQKIKPKQLQLSKARLISIINHLKQGISALDLKKTNTNWTAYYETCSYTDQGFRQKETQIETWLRQLHPGLTLDAGCNEGHFSMLAAQHSDYVLAIDNDSAVIQAFSSDPKLKAFPNILPLVMDICNPSPSIGWANQERKSFFSRLAKADLILALALIHHLAIGNNLPLTEIAAFLSKHAKHLIIEFVPKEDPQVQKLLITKKDTFTHYSLEEFIASFSDFFEIREESKAKDSGRVLFLMRSKHA